VPKTINITWLEENVYMKWELVKPTLNGSINNSYWQMPTNHHKVDLNGYVP
jgi:hypothetical protein